MTEGFVSDLVSRTYEEWTSSTHCTTYELVRDELILRSESGHDVEELAGVLASTDPGDEPTLLKLYEAVMQTTADSAWPFFEPSDLDTILGELPPASDTPAEVFPDRVAGAWLGRIAGCNLGKPVEERSWTTRRLKEYLELAGAYPLLDYIPALDPMPDGYRFRESWPETTQGRVSGSARDDDIDFSILSLHMLERHGVELKTADVAEAWLSFLPYHQVFTAERRAYANLVAGIEVADAAEFRNPYREWIGGQIRGDVYGWVNPGSPRTAALLAYQDAYLSHRGNGIYGAMWVAALNALVPVTRTIGEAVMLSLNHVPPRSRLAGAIRDVMEIHQSGASWDQAIDQIHDRYGRYFIVHTINNAAVVVAGLLWGDHDYARTVGLTVQGTLDTDSNGATAGGIAGQFVGAHSLPDRFVAPLRDRVRSAVMGFDGIGIGDLAQRTMALIPLDALDNTS